MSHEVNIKHEPVPPPRPGVKMTGGVHILIVDSKTGEVTNEQKTPYYIENERVPREERKY